MKARLNANIIAPELAEQGTRLQQAIEALGLDKSLMELVKIRASQLNGCAFCINMHTRDARKLGETEARIYLLSAWRESTVFSPKERAVLAWTETLTLVAERGAPEELFAELKRHFSDKEIVALTGAVAMINFWNRAAIGFGFVHPAEESGAR